MTMMSRLSARKTKPFNEVLESCAESFVQISQYTVAIVAAIIIHFKATRILNEVADVFVEGMQSPGAFLVPLMPHPARGRDNGH